MSTQYFLTPLNEPAKYVRMQWFDSQPVDTPEGYQWITADPSAMNVLEVLPLKQQMKQLISAGQAALADEPLPVNIRLQIYQLEAATDIAFDRNDLDAVTAAVQSFVLPENAGLSANQITLVNDLKTQMLALISASE